VSSLQVAVIPEYLLLAELSRLRAVAGSATAGQLNRNMQTAMVGTLAPCLQLGPVSPVGWRCSGVFRKHSGWTAHSLRRGEPRKCWSPGWFLRRV